MARQTARCVILALLLGIPSIANANIYERCNDAIEQGDLPTVAELSAVIQRLNDFPARQIEAAERCVSVAEGIEMKLLKGSNQFVPADQLKDRTEDQKVVRQFQQEEAERRRQEKLRRQEADNLREARNRTLVSADIHRACDQLYEQDFVAAMTNRVCIDSFVLNGHPKLPD